VASSLIKKRWQSGKIQSKKIIKRENMKKMLTVQEILDENTRIETIEDKETLKNVLRSIIDVTSYSVKKDDIVKATKEIYREYDIIL
jgi:hypothetical protein